MGEIFAKMTCKTPTTDVNPIKDQETNDQSDGRDPRRIPDDLVSCSESEPDRIVGGEIYFLFYTIFSFLIKKA